MLARACLEGAELFFDVNRGLTSEIWRLRVDCNTVLSVADYALSGFLPASRNVGCEYPGRLCGGERAKGCKSYLAMFQYRKHMSDGLIKQNRTANRPALFLFLARADQSQFWYQIL